MKPPVFLGPAFVHVECRFHDYQSFFATVLKLEPRLCDLQAYGTDGEMALINDIFGVQDGEILSTGLVDVSNEEEFDVQLGRLRQRWEKLVPGFHKWFVSQQAGTFRRYMIAPVRQLAQLGSPPTIFTNNPNESANSVVKRWTSFTKSLWPQFITHLQRLVVSACRGQQSTVWCWRLLTSP